jgi:hypothetical protein
VLLDSLYSWRSSSSPLVDVSTSLVRFYSRRWCWRSWMLRASSSEAF